MISVERLTKLYGEKAAISEVSFQVKGGEILGFLGPNGAGKTTTMRILAGYMPATSGSARIAGHDVFAQSLEARRCVGYLPESVPLYPEMTVRSYLDYMATLKGVPRKLRRGRVLDVAERCRVADVVDVRLGRLSKGYRQRVGLAQAIVHDPKVLILDEPTVGLDPKQINETRALIRALGSSHTIILSTHILPEVSMICSRVIVIADGRLVAQDTVENLTLRSQGAERIQVDVRGPAEEVRKRLQAIPSVVRVEAQPGPGRFLVGCAPGKDPREEIARAIVGAGWGLREIRPQALSLEDVYLRLISGQGGQAGSADGEAGAEPPERPAKGGGARAGQKPGGAGRPGQPRRPERPESKEGVSA